MDGMVYDRQNECEPHWECVNLAGKQRGNVGPVTRFLVSYARWCNVEVEIWSNAYKLTDNRSRTIIGRDWEI